MMSEALIFEQTDSRLMRRFGDECHIFGAVSEPTLFVSVIKNQLFSAYIFPCSSLCYILPPPSVDQPKAKNVGRMDEMFFFFKSN